MIDRVLGSLGVLCVLCGYSIAASPALNAVQPRGWQRGAEKLVTFTGANLQDAAEVVVLYPGVTFKDLKVVNPTTVTATAVIAPDCRLGEHAVRLRTATGVSDLRSFWVGALPVTEEVEPNSEFDKPQTIPLNTTVHGSIGSEDVDYFVVECKKGQRLSVEVEAMRLGTFFDPHVAILNDKRFEMVASDDSPLTAQDGGCSVVIPADGKYFVRIRESAYGGGNAYRLHVGNFPRPTAVIPSGGKPGEELEVRFIGDPTGEIKQKVKVPANPEPFWRLHCQTADGVSPTGFPFRVGDLPNTIESGANNAPAGATAGPAPGAFNGVLAKPGEVDFFKFAGKKGQTYEIQVYARRVGSPLDPVLTLFAGNGPQLAANDDSAAGQDSVVRFTPQADGDLVLSVRDHLSKGGPDYFYRVEVGPVAPRVLVSIPRADQNNPANQERQVIVVPKGGRYCTLVAANRVDFGGPLAVGFGKLPAGVTVVADPVDAGQGVVPVVLEAAADAPVAGVQTAVTMKPADPKGPADVPTVNVFEAAFAVGNPGQTVYARHVAETTVVAVAEAAPYSVTVVEPKVPVAQNGSYELKVVATRAAGFKGPITVRPVWTPPGVSFVPSATIAEGATECVLPMNAAANAAPRKWKTALLASANAGAGTVWASSQMFTVEVAPPPVTLTADRPALEQGGQTQMVCKVAVAAPFAGKAKATLLGLPAKVTAPEVEFTKDTAEVVFPITADKAAAAGKHGGVFCRVVLMQDGEPITVGTGGTEVRVDVPLPPKVAPATTAATPTPTPMPPAGQPAKRLTRLEQLRLEQEAREKAEQSGKPAPKSP